MGAPRSVFAVSASAYSSCPNQAAAPKHGHEEQKTAAAGRPSIVNLIGIQEAAGGPQ